MSSVVLALEDDNDGARGHRWPAPFSSANCPRSSANCRSASSAPLRAAAVSSKRPRIEANSSLRPGKIKKLLCLFDDRRIRWPAVAPIEQRNRRSNTRIGRTFRIIHNRNQRGKRGWHVRTREALQLGNDSGSVIREARRRLGRLLPSASPRCRLIDADCDWRWQYER